MLRTDSMSTRMAQVTNRVVACGGSATEERLDFILRQFGITRQSRDYKNKLVEYGYLTQDRRTGMFAPSPESCKIATIEVIVKPSLYAEEVRRHLVETLAAYDGLIEISEVWI